MVRKVYSIYDKKAAIHNSPVVAENDLVMVRDLQFRLEKMKDSALYKYPEDFCVKELGLFDSAAGTLTGADVVRQVVELTEIVNEIRRAEEE